MPKLKTLFSIFFVTIIFLSQTRSYASAELDRSLRLNQLGVLKPYDNVDGLFGDLLTDSIIKALKKESRFITSDLRKTSQVLTQSKTPYIKLIEDEKILTQIAKTQHLDAIIRSRVLKEGPIYRFQIDCVYGKTAQLLGTESFQVKDPFLTENLNTGVLTESETGSETFRTSIENAVDRLIRQIPFKGMITGRDTDSVTIDIGQSSGLRKGDLLIIGTIEELKEHPLLKKIVDWRFSSTGKVLITNVDESMSFGKIEGEEPGRTLSRFQKVLQIIKATETSAIDEGKRLDDEERLNELHSSPKIGYFSPHLFYGKYSREASTGSGTQGFTGDASRLGFQGDLQLWLTSRWFSDLSFSYSTGSYSQKDIATKTTTASVSNAARKALIERKVAVPAEKNPTFTFSPYRNMALFTSRPLVEFNTTRGKIIFELYADEAPTHVRSFLGLIKSGYYNGMEFYRVEPDWVIQGGDQDKTGWGGPDFLLRGETTSRLYERGSLGMARSSPMDSGSSHYFVTFTSAPNLDGLYTQFGKVVSGMDVIENIELQDKVISAKVVLSN